MSTSVVRHGSARRPRGPAAVLGALALVVVLLIAVIAITTAASAPPPLASYAPSSVQQIKKAPPNQNGNVGNPGSASYAAGSPSPKPTPRHAPAPSPRLPPSPPPVTPSSFDCVGNPPRQTFDPQSPPCIASWVGKNGGATSRGVTGSEIRVYVPDASILDPGRGAEWTRIQTDLEAYFNRHFEFYGRQLNLFPQQTGAGKEPSANATCEDVQAQAQWVAQQLVAFAALDNSQDNCWYDGLGRYGVVSVSWETNENQYEQRELAPYLYSYPGNGEGLMAAAGEFACTQLAGKRASYSTDLTLEHRTRTFGLIVSAGSTQHPTPSAPLVQALAACGQKLAASVTIVEQASDNEGQSTAETYETEQATENAVLKMRAAGVTTIICACQAAGAELSSFATSEDYFPEWIVNHMDQNFLTEEFTQKTSLLEVSSYPKQVPEQGDYFLTALDSVDPGFCPCTTSQDFFFGQSLYWELLLVASGVQMAGPDLTPASFQDGLQHTTFPNPRDPLDEGHVGFQDGGHTMVDDYLFAWWNQAAPSPYAGDPPGSWCYAEDGEKYQLGQFPKASLLPSHLSLAACDT
jgi:hypothetical protein